MSDLAPLVVDLPELDRIAGRVASVRRRMAVAGGQDVRLVAVTKTFGASSLLSAAAAGCDAIGENYAQELVAKLTVIGAASRLDELPEIHFIGQLQSNKVRTVAQIVDLYETIDRESLATEVAKRAPRARVLVQVAVDGEIGKGGCPLDDVAELVERCAALGLQVEGLMTVGPTNGDPVSTRRAFRAVRRRTDELGLSVCSMGMSGDLELAIEAGSTEVRVGSALFGPRPPMS